MQSRRSELGSSVILVAIAFTVLVFLAIASTTWAAPATQGCGTLCLGTETPTATRERKETITPPVQTKTPVTCGDPGECVSASKSISVPVGVIPPGGKLVLEPLDGQPPCPASPDGQIYLDHCFKVSWLDGNGKFMTTLAHPVLDCLSFSTSDVTTAGGKAENLLIGFVYGDPTAKWTLVKPTVNGNQVCAKPGDPFYYQALFTPKPTLPVTGADNSPTYWMVLTVLLGALCAAIAWRIARPLPR